MNLRTVLVAVVVLATVGFVVGVTTERSGEHHETTGAVTERHSGEAEGSEQHSEGESATHKASEGGEFRPLGVNPESTALIILAVVASLVLVAAVYLRPSWLLALVLLLVTMGVFAVFDIAEVFHQLDIDKTGLAILAGVVALLHISAAAISGRMIQTRDLVTT